MYKYKNKKPMYKTHHNNKRDNTDKINQNI